MKLLILFIVQILVDAWDDAISTKLRSTYTKGRNKLQKDLHKVQSLHILVWLLIIYFFIIGSFGQIHLQKELLLQLTILGKLICSYALIRFAIFDYAYNIFTGSNPYYIGKYSFEDIILAILSKILIKFPNVYIYGIFIVRIFCVYLSYIIIDNLLK